MFKYFSYSLFYKILKHPWNEEMEYRALEAWQKSQSYMYFSVISSCSLNFLPYYQSVKIWNIKGAVEVIKFSLFIL